MIAAEIQSLARKAGLLTPYGEWRWSEFRLARFAALVAGREREACIECISRAQGGLFKSAQLEAIDAIRARGHI